MGQVATIKVSGGPKGTLVINADQLAEYRKKGYRPIGEATPKTQADTGNSGSSEQSPQGQVPPSKGTKVRVRKSAAQKE